MILRQLPLPRQVKVEVLKRVLAKFIDLGLMSVGALIIDRFILTALLGGWAGFLPLGAILGFLYSILGDGLRTRHFNGQSIGKKLLGLRVVSLHDRQPIDFRTSALRNAPVGLATFFAIIPIWGWAILVLLGPPLMLIEVGLMLREEHGHRIGDALADTEVIAEGENILMTLRRRLRARWRARGQRT